MASCTLYLEQYVESTTTLPAELQRILNTIRFLDEKSNGLKEQVAAQLEALVNMPVAGQRTPQEDQDFREMHARVSQLQMQLLQFAEEKVQLGQQANDLLQMHHDELEKTLEQFEVEFSGPSLHLAPSHDYHPFEHYGAPSKAAARASMGGRGAYDSWDPNSLDPLGAPVVKRTGGGGGGQKANKRQREERNATAAVFEQDAGGYALPPAPSGVLGGVGVDGGISTGGYSGGGGPGSAGGADMGGIPPAPLAGAGAPPPLVFSNSAATANLLDAAPQPQLPGRLLRMEDINVELVGKLAEMFWPDDNMWYLIEIQRVNPSDKTATIVYKTGEIEDLNLQEIAQEGHMSLIEDRA